MTRRDARTCSLVVATIAMFSWPAIGGAQPANITPFDIAGATSTRLVGVNDRGQIVGSYDDGVRVHGFVYTGEEVITIDVPGAASTVASGINRRGDIVGTYTDDARNPHGFLRTPDGIVTVDVPDALGTIARGINDLRQIVGTYMGSDGQIHGFLLSDGEFTTIDGPGADRTDASGINNAGEIVGSYFGYPGYFFAFSRAPDGTLRPFALASSTGTRALGINDGGQIVGEFDSAGVGQVTGFLLPSLARCAFVCLDADVIRLDVPNAGRTSISAINDAAPFGLVGTYTDTPFQAVPAHGFTATFPNPCDVNADGRVNRADVRRVRRQANGLLPPTADINGDGVVDQIDVARVMNAARGLGCRQEP